MAQYQDNSVNSGAVEPSGAPLGGIGTGCIEMGLDGRFRNITINNNRTAATRIPVSGGGFLAVRAAQKGRVYARVLHPHTELPFQEAGLVPPYVAADELSWRGLYPCAHYLL
ncbi:MAG TPA: hypothetical protein HPP83_02930, partial [Candidatus Hydrogenedentes bacterium]|nr:hypothetical protein [Candidatus Hydrogenedentota bacterium]